MNRSDLGIWAVADGAGGHQSGDVASRILAEALAGVPDHLSGAAQLTEIRNRIAQAQAALSAEAARRGGQAVLASTLVVLLASEQHFACLWAGDSRIYLLREGALTRLTRDHSLVQELVDSGAITSEQAENHPRANVITRAISSDAVCELDKLTDQMLPGDRFLLCSDGVTKAVPETELADLLRSAAADAPAARVIAAALAHQATDNVTAVVVDLLP